MNQNCCYPHIFPYLKIYQMLLRPGFCPGTTGEVPRPSSCTWRSLLLREDKKWERKWEATEGEERGIGSKNGGCVCPWHTVAPRHHWLAVRVSLSYRHRHHHYRYQLVAVLGSFRHAKEQNVTSIMLCLRPRERDYVLGLSVLASRESLLTPYQTDEPTGSANL